MLRTSALLLLLTSNLTVHAARVVLSDDAHANRTEDQAKPCAKCPVLNCKGGGYSLKPDDEAPLEDGKGSSKYYTLTISSSTNKPGAKKKKEVSVKVVLDMLYDEGKEGGGYASATGVGNCFAFSTHQEYQIPGGSPTIVNEFKDNDRFNNNGISPVDTLSGGSGGCGGVLDPCLGAALEEREGAFYLGNPTKVGQGLDNVKLPLINKKTGEALGDDPDAKYYLIAAFLKKNTDYHFWGLFRDVGWACVPSKAGRSDVRRLATPIRKHVQAKGEDKWGLKSQCPGNTAFTLMNQYKGTTYDKSLKHVGYYLFPCRGEC